MFVFRRVVSLWYSRTRHDIYEWVRTIAVTDILSIPEDYPISTYHQDPSPPLFFPFWYHVPHHHHRHSSYPQTNIIIIMIIILKKRSSGRGKVRRGKGKLWTVPTASRIRALHRGNNVYKKRGKSHHRPSPSPSYGSILYDTALLLWYGTPCEDHTKEVRQTKRKEKKKRKENARHVYDPYLRLTEWIDPAKKRSNDQK